MEKLLLSAKDLSILLGVSKVTLWRIQKKDPSFPKSHLLTPKKKLWKTEEIMDWIRKYGSTNSPKGEV